MISWNKQAGCHIADIGDLRIILKEHDKYWQLSMGFRIYTKDGSQSMIRPTSNITQFEKPCDIEQAKKLAHSHVEKFVSGIMADLS